MSSLSAFIAEIESLKNIDRTGYKQRGIPQPENVAEHSYSTLWYALILATKESADVEKTLKMALMHDIGEVRLGDFSYPMVQQYLSDQLKYELDKQATWDVLDNLPAPLQEEMQAIFEEFLQRKTLEANIVHNADKLQMMGQIVEYEKMYSINFHDFWQFADEYQWLASAREIYDVLKKSRTIHQSTM